MKKNNWQPHSQISHTLCVFYNTKKPNVIFTMHFHFSNHHIYYIHNNIVLLYPLYYISSTSCDFMVDLHCYSGVRNRSCFQFIPLQQVKSLKLPLHSQPTWRHSTLLVIISSKTLGKLLSWWASEINVRRFSLYRLLYKSWASQHYSHQNSLYDLCLAQKRPEFRWMQTEIHCNHAMTVCHCYGNHSPWSWNTRWDHHTWLKKDPSYLGSDPCADSCM